MRYLVTRQFALMHIVDISRVLYDNFVGTELSGYFDSLFIYIHVLYYILCILCYIYFVYLMYCEVMWVTFLMSVIC